MKTIKVKPILIESKGLAKIGDIVKSKFEDIHILTKNDSKEYAKTTNKQELIFISLKDEKIEVGNICYYENRFNGGKFLVIYTKYGTYHELGIDPIKEYGHIEGGITPLKSEIFKIIAHQSQIPPEYISKFIKQYNNKCIEDLEIEMEEIKAIGGEFGYKAKDLIFPKLTNGFITIVEKQEPIIYTEEQVLKLIQNWSNYLYDCKCYDITPMKYYEWFNENK